MSAVGSAELISEELLEAEDVVLTSELLLLIAEVSVLDAAEDVGLDSELLVVVVSSSVLDEAEDSELDSALLVLVAPTSVPEPELELVEDSLVEVSVISNELLVAWSRDKELVDRALLLETMDEAGPSSLTAALTLPESVKYPTVSLL